METRRVAAPAPSFPGLSLRGPAVGMLVDRLLRPEVAAAGLLFLLLAGIPEIFAQGPRQQLALQLVVAIPPTAVLLRQTILRREGLVKDRVLAWMLVYGAAMALSSLDALDYSATFSGVLGYLRHLALVFLLINLVTSVAGLRLASWALVAAGGFLAVASLVGAALDHNLGGLASENTGHIVGSLFDSRMGGPRGGANYLAQMLVLLVPVALYRAWDEQRGSLRLAAYVVVALLTLVIALTFSRAGFVGLLAVSVLAIVMRRPKPAQLLAVGLALSLVALAAPRSYWDRIGATAQYVAALPEALSSSAAVAGSDQSAASSDDSSSDESLEQRSRLWRIGVLMFLEHPLTGVGRKNYLRSYPDYAQRADPALPSEPLTPHNLPIQIAAETGLLGLASFSICVLAAVYGLRAAKRRFALVGLGREVMLLEAVEIAIYAYLITSLFLEYNWTRYLWLLIALAVIGRQLALRHPALSTPAADRVRGLASGTPT